MLNSHKCPGKRESKKRNKKGGKGRCCCKQDDDRVTREQVLVGSEGVAVQSYGGRGNCGCKGPEAGTRLLCSCARLGGQRRCRSDQGGQR